MNNYRQTVLQVYPNVPLKEWMKNDMTESTYTNPNFMIQRPETNPVTISSCPPIPNEKKRHQKEKIKSEETPSTIDPLITQQSQDLASFLLKKNQQLSLIDGRTLETRA